MGGRGASSGMSVDKRGKPLAAYGTEYKAVYQSGNIKFLEALNGVKAPLETMTSGRIYVTLGTDGKPRYISYYDKRNRKMKQIDIVGKAHIINGKWVLPHTHKGYIHDEKGSFTLSLREQKMVERVLKIWYNRHSK